MKAETYSTTVLTVQEGLKLLSTSQVERLLLLWQRMNAVNEVNGFYFSSMTDKVNVSKHVSK